MTEDRKAGMLRKVRAMIAQAEGTNHPEEADAFRRKADELMTAYAILEWELEQAEPGQSILPERRYYEFGWYWDESFQQPVRNALWWMMNDVALFARCRVISQKVRYGYENSDNRSTIDVLGLPSDLNYMDMLFTSLMVDMLGNLEPKPQLNLSMIENLVRMKEAGMKWERIGKLLYDAGQLEAPYTRNTGVRFTKLYTDYCTNTNRPRLRVSPQVYQRSYSEAYSLEVGRRLREMRERRTSTDAVSDGNKYALVVKSTEQKLADLYAELYPDLVAAAGKPRRGRAVTKANSYKYSTAAMEAGRQAGQAARIVQPGEKLTSNRRALDS